MKEEKQNGQARKKKLLDFIRDRVKKPETLSKVYSQAKRRKEFSTLTSSTFYYNVKQLALDGALILTESRDFHPKRKPMLLINPINQTATI